MTTRNPIFSAFCMNPAASARGLCDIDRKLTRDLVILNNSIDITQSASASCRTSTKCRKHGISPIQD